MNTKFEFIHFVQRPTKSPAAVTTAWACLNNRTNDQLGTIAKWLARESESER